MSFISLSKDKFLKHESEYLTQTLEKVRILQITLSWAFGFSKSKLNIKDRELLSLVRKVLFIKIGKHLLYAHFDKMYYGNTSSGGWHPQQISTYKLNNAHSIITIVGQNIYGLSISAGLDNQQNHPLHS